LGIDIGLWCSEWFYAVEEDAVRSFHLLALLHGPVMRRFITEFKALRLLKIFFFIHCNGHEAVCD
jgi:hypothetical protein